MTDHFYFLPRPTTPLLVAYDYSTETPFGAAAKTIPYTFPILVRARTPRLGGGPPTWPHRDGTPALGVTTLLLLRCSPSPHP